MKVEERGVRCKIYNGCCTKQWIIILKATWTSSIIGRKFTCQTSSNKASLMKDDVNDEVPNGTPKTLIPTNGMVNWDRVLKLDDKPRGDHATHFLGWIEWYYAQSFVYKCSM